MRNMGWISISHPLCLSPAFLLDPRILLISSIKCSHSLLPKLRTRISLSFRSLLP